ncbi:hypothetical protein L2E82_07936 [Cichorium intybus]|uniref:Uncharacterized protein n=1 Tax=Cichorium intybus TaxID=13427 RepID=A0ACB9G5T6_CICIN|nr:hypothetical protein L2E82_07936 [Cichorium intybus]
MAPKRRRQTGLTRMDAALDQVSCLGFSKQLIRRTVRNLLKVYGDDGWKLIEEDSYKVVLDVILDEQETAKTQNLLKLDASSSQQENTGKQVVMADLNEVSAKDESFEGNNNASLTIHTDNDECSKDTTINGTAHSSTFHDDQKMNIQCSENAPHPEPSSDVAHTPISFEDLKWYPVIMVVEGIESMFKDSECGKGCKFLGFVTF